VSPKGTLSLLPKDNQTYPPLLNKFSNQGKLLEFRIFKGSLRILRLMLRRQMSRWTFFHKTWLTLWEKVIHNLKF